MSALRAAALALAFNGWQVLPVGTDKRPIPHLVPNGFTSASSDPAIVGQWFDGPLPPNVAIVIPPGYLVVDVDDHVALAALERKHGPLPATRESRTGSGGRHVWLRVERDDLVQRKLCPGVDVRVAGKGYVVAPPSVHASGRPYTWTDERTDIAEAPAWLVAALAPDVAPAVPAGELAGTGGDDARARHYLATCDPAVAGQGGHDATIRAAGVVVRGFALGEARGLDLLREVYNPRCVPPWSEKELRHKAADAARSKAEPSWGSMLATTVVPAVPKTPRRTLAERFGALRDQGPQLPTGMATADAATRGGPRTSKLVLVGGAPGACKTALVTQWAVGFASRGVPVCFLAFDEEADAIAIRIGQTGGQVREHLEAGAPHAVEAAAARAAGALASLDLVDGEDEGATIEEAAERLRARAGTGPAVLIVDSLQTARLATPGRHDSRRGEIDAVVAALKTAMKRHGLLVIATTELARGAYRSKAASEQIDDLAAAKESGGIEYAASVLLVLRSVPGTPDLVDVAMPKNRLGPKLPWRFRMDFDRATVTEVDRPAEPTAGGRFEALKVEVLTVVRLAAEAGRPLASASALAREVKGRKADILDALRELTLSGEVIADGRTIRPAKGVGSLTAAAPHVT